MRTCAYTAVGKYSIDQKWYQTINTNFVTFYMKFLLEKIVYNSKLII